MKDPLPQRELTAKDRAKAVTIAGVDMYIYDHKHQLTGEKMASERFMVIRAQNGRKYVFREMLMEPKKSEIIT